MQIHTEQGGLLIPHSGKSWAVYRVLTKPRIAAGSILGALDILRGVSRMRYVLPIDDQRPSKLAHYSVSRVRVFSSAVRRAW